MSDDYPAGSRDPLQADSPGTSIVSLSGPRRYLTRMGLFSAAAAASVAALAGPLREAFLANVALNGLIVFVLLFGVLYIFRQVVSLFSQVHWIESFRRGLPAGSPDHAPTLLKPMARMLGTRTPGGPGSRATAPLAAGDGRESFSLSAPALRSILDGLSARLDESREIVRYLVGLPIFLGLLGTFWGLLETVSSVSGVITNLQSAGTDDVAAVFRNLTTGLEAPLAGMGTAFSSSLFGLAGALLLGFLDLQANQAQNRFYNDLEEWLSGATRLSGGVGAADMGEQNVPAYIQALLETTADSLDNLQRTIAHGEESRTRANVTLTALAAKLTTLSDQMKAEQEVLVRLAENQAGLRPVLERLAMVQGTGFDDSSRDHLRNLDVYLARVLEEVSSGRDRMVQELRAEIRLVARTLAALAEGAEQ